MKEILNEFQKKLLKEIGKNELSSYFIWSGGTALSYKYLQHRKSVDLDFLSQELLPDEYLLSLVKQISKNLKIKKIEEQKRFNRHQFWLYKNKKALKLEFIFYPFSFIKKPAKIQEFGLKIDSIEDILTNKAHALFERTEPKDVFDIYWILQTKNIKFSKIFQWVKKKFGVEIDPVIFSSKALETVSKIQQIKPLVLHKKFLVVLKMKNYFESEAQKYLSKQIK